MTDLPVLRWGILGTGNIASKFAADLNKLGGRAKLIAVGSRRRASSEEFRDKVGAQFAYGSYEELVTSAEIDAVYISLPNHLHCEWSLRALAAGKHVLCEKPAGMTAAEVQDMTAAARQSGCLWLEAFAYRCHPRYQRVAQIIQDGLLGELRLAHATFCFNGGGMGRGRLWDPAMGGGAVMDVGVYPLSWLRMVARFAGLGEPTVVHSTGLIKDGVDVTSTGILGFANGFSATWQTAIGCAAPSVGSIHGTHGQLEIRSPWKADDPSMILRRPGHDDQTFIDDDGEPLYGREALEVARCAAAGQSPACTWDDSLAQARLLDTIRRQLSVRWPGEA